MSHRHDPKRMRMLEPSSGVPSEAALGAVLSTPWFTIACGTLDGQRASPPLPVVARDGPPYHSSGFSGKVTA